MYITLVNRIVRRILCWRTPNLALVRALVDAFETLAGGSPASWRSIHLRRRAARYIASAAEILEGPIARGSGPLISSEKVGVSDLGRPRFEILYGFVVLLRQTT
jgi:hypothetical protein